MCDWLSVGCLRSELAVDVQGIVIASHASETHDVSFGQGPGKTLPSATDFKIF